MTFEPGNVPVREQARQPMFTFLLLDQDTRDVMFPNEGPCFPNGGLFGQAKGVLYDVSMAALNALDLPGLRSDWHRSVNDANASFQRHGFCQLCFSYTVHVGGYDRDLQVVSRCKPGREPHLAAGRDSTFLRSEKKITVSGTNKLGFDAFHAAMVKEI